MDEASRAGGGGRCIGVAGALAALLGVLTVHALPTLPPRWLDALLATVALAALARPRWRLPAMLVLGFAWCALRADVALEARLPRALEGRDFDLVVVIDDLPRQRADATRLQVRIERATLDGADLALPGRARLSWYGPPPPGLDACSRWQLRARLKRPRGLVNPGGFDAERQALERGIVAVGYVRDVQVARRLGDTARCVDGLRERLSREIAARVADAHDATLLQTFAVGDTRGLSPDDWEIARANGVPHLIAISGFHVGMAALFGALLVRLLWRVWPRLGLHLPVQVAEAPAALLVAVGYGLLAGGSLPTLRTLLMIGVVTAMRCGRRAGSGPHGLALALLAMLLVDPLATLAPGFWLSFVGVAFLMLCLGRGGRGVRGAVRELGLGQLVMTVSLLPLTVWFFGEASLVGALSNLIAVPLVSFVIVPLCLLGVLCLLLVPPVATPVLALAAWAAHGQWWLLERMATWPGAHWYLPEVAPWALLAATLGAAWLFLPRGVPLRVLGVVLFLPVLLPARSLPPEGAFETWLVDVGQGLAVLVRTRGHAVLFDAGARYPSGFDLGEAAVLPTLRALGIGQLDRLIISHGDNDHAGGAAAVADAHPEALVLAGEPLRLPLPSRQCAAGQHWQMDGVAFRILHPPPAPAGLAGNDHSCVLLVEGRGGRLLLTGDISSRVEAAVAAAVGGGAPLVLVAPHHGSRSSSGGAFLAALEPSLALVSAGWRSRFGHPHPAVVERYAAIGAPLWNTADHGALQVAFPDDAAPRIVGRERMRQHRYWRE